MADHQPGPRLQALGTEGSPPRRILTRSRAGKYTIVQIWYDALQGCGIHIIYPLVNLQYETCQVPTVLVVGSLTGVRVMICRCDDHTFTPHAHEHILR